MPGLNSEGAGDAISQIQRIHSVVYNQAFSECGNYLAVADNHGFVSIFR